MRRLLMPLVTALCSGTLAASAEPARNPVGFVNPPGKLGFLETAFGHGAAPRAPRSPVPPVVGAEAQPGDGVRFDMAVHGTVEFGIVRRWVRD